MNPTLLPVRIIAVLLALGAAIGLRLLATAIRRLDPATRALGEARAGRGAEEDLLGPEEPRILDVLGRFVRAAGDLEAGALLALALAAASAASAFPHKVGMGLSLAISFLCMPLLLGVLPERIAAGRVSAVLGRAAPGILLLAWLFHPITIARDLLTLPFRRMLEKSGREAVAPGPGPLPTPVERAPEPAHAPADPAAASGSGLRQVIEFTRATVDEVMTPRDEVVAIESGTSIGDLVQVVQTTHRGTYPIYRTHLDELVGQVSIADLLMEVPADATVDHYRRDVVVVPESKRVVELVQEMRGRGFGLAMVIDEFGSASGLANLHDLVGALVGEMAVDKESEADSADFETRRLDLHSWVLNPRTRIERVNELLGLSLPEGDYQTIAGFILDQMGRIPLPRERLRVPAGEFEVLAADARRIVSIRFRRAVPGARA